MLALRSDFFYGMLCGQMMEARQNRVVLHNVLSSAMKIVIQYIYTMKINEIDETHLFSIFKTAGYFQLPILRDLTLKQIGHVRNLKIAADILNNIREITIGNDNKMIYRHVLRPFYSRPLVIGDLNELNEESLELLLLHSSEITKEFNTSEFGLFLCVLDWIWMKTSNDNISTMDWRDFLRDIQDLSKSPEVSKISDISGHLKVVKESKYFAYLYYIRYRLICSCFMERVFTIFNMIHDGIIHVLKTFTRHNQDNACTTAHVPKCRGRAHGTFEWEYPWYLKKGIRKCVIPYPVSCILISRILYPISPISHISYPRKPTLSSNGIFNLSKL